MNESTFKSGRKKGFVVLYREAAQDSRLSLEARGLFALMVSLPDNWEYTVSGLAAKAGCGKDKVRRLLRELQEIGYLVREQGHDAGGKFASNIYVLQDEAPLSGNTVNGENRQRCFPLTEKPSTVFATQKNKEKKNTEIEKNKDQKEPPKAPQGARKSKYALQEDAKPILREYVGSDQELDFALADFIQLREQKQAINSAAAIKALLTKLDRLSGGDREIKLQLINEAMANSWKSVFPMRQSGGKRGQYGQSSASENSNPGTRLPGVYL